uniref:hypothetical protein n=1 Tax=Providencia sp. PROV265 TaxID=2949953 RepID=UPI00234B3313|nr:hypothetical protein [Providencia sp. PROV265]
MNYKEILENAVKAAQKTQNDLREIKNSIESLNISIQDFTDGKMHFVISEKSKNKDIPGSSVLSGVTAAIFASHMQIPYKALCFYLPYSNQEFELAELATSESGYPCKITYSNKDVYCANREEFEQALADLMNTPNAGEILLEVMPK